MIEVGSMDRLTVVIGEKGTGKSTWTKLDARVFQRQTGGWVIGHSPRGQIGVASDIVLHDTVKKLARGLKRDPGRIHIVTDDSPEDVLEYGKALALASRKRAFKEMYPFKKFRPNRPAPTGMKAPPVLVIVDEGTHVSGDLSKEGKADLQRFLTSLRHEHLAITFLSQAPTARSWTYQEQASGFRVFRYMHEWGLNSIRAAAIPKDRLDEIRELPDFQYFRLDKKNPRAAGFEKLPPPP